MFLAIYLFSLILGPLGSLTQCSQGYITDGDCSTQDLLDVIFTGIQLSSAADSEVRNKIPCFSSLNQ